MDDGLINEYFYLENKMLEARDNKEYQIEDNLLDEMDVLWFSLSNKQIQTVNQMMRDRKTV